MSTTIENNVIIHTIQKGIDSSISIAGIDWATYDDIRCQVKSVNRIEAPAILDLFLSKGDLVIDVDQLVIPITGLMSLKLSSHRHYFDVKLIVEDTVLEPVIPGEIIIDQTVTNTY